MEKRTSGLIGLIIISWALSSGVTPLLLTGGAGFGPAVGYQESGRPQDDYMSALLARNADPIGLKENPELQKLLDQPVIKWAVRSAAKHVLD